MIIFSVVSAVFSGRIDETSQAVFDSAASAVELVLKLLGILCLWCGLMNIAEKSGLCRLVARLLNPVLKLLFPENKNDDRVMDAVAMNVTANIFGLGNAATPLGIEAVSRMQKNNTLKQSASADMMIFVVLNTAALRLLPSTVAALRASAGAKAPMDIIVCVWISSAAALITAVGAVKLTGRFTRK